MVGKSGGLRTRVKTAKGRKIGSTRWLDASRWRRPPAAFTWASPRGSDGAGCSLRAFRTLLVDRATGTVGIPFLTMTIGRQPYGATNEQRPAAVTAGRCPGRDGSVIVPPPPHGMIQSTGHGQNDSDQHNDDADRPDDGDVREKSDDEQDYPEDDHLLLLQREIGLLALLG